MKERKWLSYWKKCLSDIIKAKIDVEEALKSEETICVEIEGFDINLPTIQQADKINALIDTAEKRINKTNRVNKGWLKLQEIQVLISPMRIVTTPEHLFVSGQEEKTKFPFWYFATIDRTGKLCVPDTYFPVFPRKYLKPLADEERAFTFSSVSKVDKAATGGKVKYKTYKEYIEYVKSIFKLTTGQDVNSYVAENNTTQAIATILLPNPDNNAPAGVLRLYEAILKEESIPPLLSELIKVNNPKQHQPLAVSDLIDANIMHLGQMGNAFPLSFSQRKSLYTFLHANDKVFAVNGPPGTGKTTLLQSIVANKFVESAIAGENPPVILACSTNNQAVTNIIDSFSKIKSNAENLEGRWLPEVMGYATYLPAESTNKETLKEINYKSKNGEGLFSKIENTEYLEKAKQHFLLKAASFFTSDNHDIKNYTELLRLEILKLQATLKEASRKWKVYLEAEELFTSFFDNHDAIKYYSGDILNEHALQSDIKKLTTVEENIISYFRNEPVFRKLLCSIGIKSALKDRESELRRFLRGVFIPEINTLTQSALLKQTDTKIKTTEAIIKSILEWRAWKEQNNIKGNPPKNTDAYREQENSIANNPETKNQSGAAYFYNELDITLRHKAFLLAVHYWEGRWLQKLEQDLAADKFSGRTEVKVKNTWQRQAMITPCFVSTFYMAPGFFNFYKPLEKEGKTVHNNPPLYNFIDLLIVDEAGQVSPEVGVATFALAKQAVVVGDLKQIEPVWSLTHTIDLGNLKESKLIKDSEDLSFEKEFDPKGFLVSTGSIMKMAQNACNYKEEGFQEKGVTLVEHRRCYDEIINYCNALAYNGQLKPLKGKAEQNTLFPPMYCIHVEGKSSTSNSSRYNTNEAETIAAWLKTNKQLIESRYKKVEKAVGIITPFADQKKVLQSALKKAGFDSNTIKIGTVHALQGAERPIILFSMVYGEGDTGTMFFDRGNKPNMLNVAVSRAQDNFIVFANTTIFNKKAKTPSGILANYLTYEVKAEAIPVL